MSRNKKNKRNNNQDVLTTRLIQISLKMDDHIYSNRPISVTAAAEYLQEIANLKLKCPRSDVRALQVIEKLTRCMKGIIAEDQDDVAYVPVSHDGASTEIPKACSPVYSVPDEDTELLTEYNVDYDNQIIDLTEENDVNGTIVPQHESLIEKVKNAISNMGLRDEAQVEIADADCSQSILENFQNDNTNYDVNRQPAYNVVHIDNNQQKPVLNDVDEAANNRPEGAGPVENCSQRILDNLYNYNTKCIEASRDKELEIFQNITNSTQYTALSELNNPITKNNTSVTPHPTFIVEAQNISHAKILNEVDITKEIVMNMSARQPAFGAKNYSKKRRRNKNNKEDTIKEKQKLQSKTKYKPKATNKENHARRPRKKYNIVHGKGVIHSNISVDKPETTIYNKNVECDLSWVENLRYVREISPEENDTTFGVFDENFWNNFNLPDKWNDRDFEI